LGEAGSVPDLPIATIPLDFNDERVMVKTHKETGNRL